MSWINAINDIVQRYSAQGGGTAAAPSDPHADYEQVTRAAPPNVVADGLAQAFRSDKTPPFPEMIGTLFSHSNPEQRAGILNRILDAVGPGVVTALPGLGGLSSLLGGGRVTPAQASQISANQVQQMAEHAQRQDPSIVDQVSSFYAQHPQVVKAVGGLALTIALQHMLQRR
jgi:hypothetical protein